MASRITKQEEAQIVELYTSGTPSEEISKTIGRSQSSVLRVLERNGIARRSKTDHKITNKYSIEKETEIVRLYCEENRNTNELAKMFGTYNTTIRRILLRNKVELRTYGEAQKKVDCSIFLSKIGTPEFDYFLGLLATDGCITSNRVILDFSEENKELLEYWDEFLGGTCNITCSIHKTFRTPQYRIAFRDDKIVSILGEYGIVPNKTFDMHLKYINWNVLRGIIDGDGCVSATNNGGTLRIVITSGCKEFLKQIQEFYTENGITSHLLESGRNKNPTYDLYVNKSDDIIKIYSNLYLNARYFLKRKEQKFGPLLEKFGRCSLVNSGKEKCNSNPEPSLTSEEGVETLYEVPKEI